MAHLHRRLGAANVAQFGFYKIGSDVDEPLTIVEASDLDAAKRTARAAIEAEGLAKMVPAGDGLRSVAM